MLASDSGIPDSSIERVSAAMLGRCPDDAGAGDAGGLLFGFDGCAVVGVRANEKRDVFAERKEPIPAPQAESGFIGVDSGASLGLGIGESDGRELVLVREKGRRLGVFRV